MNKQTNMEEQHTDLTKEEQRELDKNVHSEIGAWAMVLAGIFLWDFSFVIGMVLGAFTWARTGRKAAFITNAALFILNVFILYMIREIYGPGYY